jgi:transcriptional regulator with XRE-family HTH domain
MSLSSFPAFPRMAFSEQLLQHRRAKGFSQQALSDRTGIHVSQIKRYEAGSAQPSIEGLKKIAMALTCATDVLVFEPNERPIADDLQRQFEAISQLPDEDRHIARTLLEGLILKHDAKRWASTNR